MKVKHVNNDRGEQGRRATRESMRKLTLGSDTEADKMETLELEDADDSVSKKSLKRASGKGKIWIAALPPMYVPCQFWLFS